MTEEAELLGRVLDTLLREDAYKLRSRATPERRADGDWLRIALEGGESVLLPVEPEGFQCDIRARRQPLLCAPATAQWAPAVRVDVEPGAAERTSAEPVDAEWAPAEPVAAEWAPADRADAEPGAAERTSAEPVDAERASAEPVDAEWAPAEWADAEPAPAEPQSALGPADGSGGRTLGAPSTAQQADEPRAPGTPGTPGAPGAQAGRPPHTMLTGLAPVLGRLRAAVPEEDRPLYDVFVTECRQALDAMRLHTRIRPGVVAELAARHGEGRWTGMPGAVAYDTLAAFRDHPVYPTSRGRAVFTEAQLRAHAPEFHPTFPLRWLVLPREAVGGDPARLPDWWPTPAQLGLGSGRPSGEGWLAFPVHPLTVGRPLEAALRAAGLEGEARLADRPLLDVRPTLSMRTVAVADDPLVHLKLPLTTSTLGMRNRRSVKPGTLIDGEVAQRLVEAVIAREPRFGATVLLADETTHLHAGHELLATLVRRYPPGLENATIVPLAGLLAPAPDGTLVIDGLAERHYGGDVLALLDDYLTLLFDFHTTLFAYGIALESHQQNISLVFEGGGGGGGGGGGDNAGALPRLRLLIKDHDGPRVHAIRLAAMVGGGPAADLCGFDDRRILTSGDGPVADVFTTITVHLCAAAPVFELARLGRAPLDTLLRRLRDRLTDAVDRLAVTRPGAAAALLRRRVLDADRLPVKAMVTAGTLFTKERSGAADINKHYVTGPNYLLRGSGR
ncbi:IucA/IucC family protein [Streptomyces violaceusniger]|uniref:IucA/IucC family protein n=1 Tax=Streptomyces violaceusniger TaxID=68280 RepID=UPI000998900F|nr:IucA/IucC family protein [Streptomyces hygroscopicus]AQW49817.1 IucA/IucC family protein [Streptomyces hygroscopicus]